MIFMVIYLYHVIELLHKTSSDRQIHVNISYAGYHSAGIDTVSDGCLFQLFQQELSSRQAMVNAIRSAVDNTDSAVSSQIEALNKAWQEVNRLSELRDLRLHEALVLVSS